MTPHSDANIYPWLIEHWSFFIQCLEQDRLAHALMIEGPVGSGKTALADAMMGKLLCSEHTAENDVGGCGQCRSCKLLVGGAHPDRFDIQPLEMGKAIKIDQVRGLIATLNLTTSISACKVAYIHPAESMTTAAANALLKSLEEPVGNAVLILVCNDPGSLPVTIRSRCQSIHIHQPDNQLVLDWLNQTCENSDEESRAALAAAGGSPLRAAHYLSSPEQDSFARVREGLNTLISRPGSVSLISTELAALESDYVWRWLSLCVAEAVKAQVAGKSLNWLPTVTGLQEKTLLQLQKRADQNRKMSASPVRGDLLLQDWLIRWAEQGI